MHIGMTYDLRDDYLARGYSPEQTAEFDSEETVCAIETILCRLGHVPDRIGSIDRLVERLARGERWDLVFNIAEGLCGAARESQVPNLLDAYGIPYTFSDPLVLALTLDKSLAKRVLRDMGLPTPEFAVVRSVPDTATISTEHRLFAKPLSEGTGKGVDAASVVRSRAQLEQVCAALLERFRQPVLVERYLPGREFTVSILGTGEHARSIGVLEVLLRDVAEAEVYSMENKERCEDLVDYRLCADLQGRAAEELALAAWRGLGCRDAGRVDVRLDEEGRPQVIELNPLAGLHPSHSDLPITCTLAGMSYDTLLEAIVDSAMERVAPAPVRGAA